MVFRKREDIKEDPDSSGTLFDTLRQRYKLKSDKRLADWLGVSTSYVSKIRHGIHDVNDEIILHVHEETAWPIAHIKDMIRTGGLRE